MNAPLETPSKVNFRAATPQEDGAIAEHFYRMWRDLGIADAAILPQWPTRCTEFIAHARQHLHYQAFVAEVEGCIVGSAGGQRFDGLYPWVFSFSDRQYGYIWGVYVEPEYRQQGIATRLTQQVVEHLHGIGCTKVVLNAAPKARLIYQRLGWYWRLSRTLATQTGMTNEWLAQQGLLSIRAPWMKAQGYDEKHANSFSS